MTEVYKGMTAEFLESEYNLRARRGPDLDDLMASWVDRSAKFRAVSGGQIDLAYGDGERDTLDYFSTASKQSPVLFFIHGGYWQRGDKSIYSFIAENFLKHGVSVALVNYTLTPSVRIGEIPAQLQRAIAWLWQQSDSLGFNRDRFIVSGHSAGGHLTARMMATQWSQINPQLPSDLIRAGVPMSGLYELEPLVHTSINQGPQMDIDEAKRESPCNIPPVTDAPQFVVVGGGESSEFFRQADDYVNQYQSEARVMNRLDVLNDDHFDLLETLADESSGFFGEMMSLIDD